MANRLKSNKLTMFQDQIVEAYRNGATLRQIGEVHNASPGTVRNLLVEIGEPLRRRGRRKLVDLKDPRILPVDREPEVEVSESCEERDCEDCEDQFELPGMETYEGGLF